MCDLRHIVRLRYKGLGKYFPNPLGKDPFERVFYSIYIYYYGVAPFKTPLLLYIVILNFFYQNAPLMPFIGYVKSAFIDGT